MPSPYQTVQFVGHSLCSAPEQDAQGNLTYLGNPSTNQDYALRCDVVDQAIQQAVRQDSIDNNPRCLKIYMMPEFFFRGVNGAYPVDRTSAVVLKLQELVRKPEYEDWLFVFGTILSQSIDTGVDRYQAYNHCLVQKGGAGPAEDDGRLIIKEFKSNIDFIAWQRLSARNVPFPLMDEWTDHLSRLPSSMAGIPSSEWQLRHDDGHCIFVLDGLTIGVEICLDHLMQRIKNSMTPPALDIQLVTSCGMQLMDSALNLRDGGLAFCTDGAALDGSTHAGRPYKTEVKTVTNGQIQAMTATHGGPVQRVPLAISAAAALFFGGAGSLEIYPALPL
ncbi:MAG TPA: hypothetical protein VIR28_04605 [Achromobacter sp.]|uniref:hypothetical protein n=1 Tax=Achromobacter sp. TaxID=134375 RepID=UPI002F95D500